MLKLCEHSVSCDLSGLFPVSPVSEASSLLHSLSPLSLYHNCDSTAIRLRYDYDEKLTCSFFARVEWKKQAQAIRRSRIVLVSQL